ncbi:serine/threonine-protein kinase HipA [Bradyrhizobium sp. USDA 4341]
MLRVWADGKPVGLLDRHGHRGATFVYDRGVEPTNAVSLTMPARSASWNFDFGLLPIFDMNLPEGALRTEIQRRFAKATGSFDDFDLIAVVGRSQIGRLRLTPPDVALDETVPFTAIDEILSSRRGSDLYDYLLDRYAGVSGASGVQPKVLARTGEEKDSKLTVKGATHIVKVWKPGEFPELAANEWFCLEAARRAGLEVPRNELSADGSALVVERFDLNDDGTYRGFEDFCVLNALQTRDKYNGGYETRIFRRAAEYVGADPASRRATLRGLFRLFVLNCAVQNGDAHSKNWGLLYDDVTGVARLAPVYDVVTTTVYVPNDKMALSLGGSTNWPNVKKLTQLGQTRCDLTPKEIGEILEQTADAVTETAPRLAAWFADRGDRDEVGRRMLMAWADGVRHSLGFDARSVSVRPIEELPAQPSP